MVDQRRAEAIDNCLTEAGFHVALPHLHYGEGGKEPATWTARVSAPLETWEGWVPIAKVEEAAAAVVQSLSSKPYTPDEVKLVCSAITAVVARVCSRRVVIEDV